MWVLIELKAGEGLPAVSLWHPECLSKCGGAPAAGLAVGGTWSQGEALPKLLQPGVHLLPALFFTLPSVHLCVGGQDLRDTFQIA